MPSDSWVSRGMSVWLVKAAKVILALPIYVLYWFYRIGLLRFATGSCGLALAPGAVGVWWRRCWYKRTLQHCGENLSVDWMAVIFRPETQVGDTVYIGPYSSIIDADIGDDVMIGANVAVARGGRQHGFERLDIPMNRQPGQRQKVEIGGDVWIGTAAVVLAQVSRGSIVGAGAVVTKPFEAYSILGGVPARVIGRRRQIPEETQD